LFSPFAAWFSGSVKIYYIYLAENFIFGSGARASGDIDADRKIYSFYLPFIIPSRRDRITLFWG
jgi:hypothetical protein